MGQTPFYTYSYILAASYQSTLMYVTTRAPQFFKCNVFMSQASFYTVPASGLLHQFTRKFFTLLRRL